MRLSETYGQIMIVDPNKVATETGHTHSTIRWKKGSIDSMIGIVYIITLKDFSYYNDFTLLALISLPVCKLIDDCEN